MTAQTLKRCITGLAAAATIFLAGYLIANHHHSQPSRIVAAFHDYYHRNGDSTFNNTFWFGVPVQKTPLDLWIFQEIIQETKPDVIVETGTYRGGSSHFYASLFDLMGHGRVITVDIEDYPGKPQHPRVTFLHGSSTAPEILSQIRNLISENERVMVFLDSDHSREHVLDELELYHPLVTPGCYLIVEDTHFNGHPILANFGPGPMEALEEFLAINNQFQPDSTREKFGLTFNPRGFLRRVQ